MHVLPQPVHGGAGQTEGQLQVLLGELQGPDARVQSGPWGKSESHQTALSARTLSATLPVDFGKLFQVLSSTFLLPWQAFLGPVSDAFILGER